MFKLTPFLLLIAFAILVPSPFVISNSPYEATMGVVSYIFYYHVPLAITFMLSSFVCGIAGIVYLVKRSRGADSMSLAAGELCILLGILVIATGSIWARKTWGVWWVWEARLTITLVMLMLFVAYRLLRKFGGPGTETLAAAVSIFAMVLVPFLYWSVNMWQTMHPTTEVLPRLPPAMMWTIRLNMLGFFALYTALVVVRARLERSAAALEDAYVALEE
jgi:heme exporter protein C